MNINQQPPPLERVAYSPTEFAAIFGWSRAHVYNMIRRGELRAGKIGGTPRISASEVERLRSVLDAGLTAR